MAVRTTTSGRKLLEIKGEFGRSGLAAQIQILADSDFMIIKLYDMAKEEVDKLREQFVKYNLLLEAEAKNMMGG